MISPVPVMEGTVALLIPVLGRPERVRPFIEGLDPNHQGTPFFLCNLDDLAQINGIVEAGEHPVVVEWSSGRGDYARKINFGFRRAHHLGYEWILLGADDITFKPNWVREALLVHNETGACVIGTNDLGNPTVMSGQHATHSLVHRDYLDCGTIDEDGKIVHEGYWHNWVDNEFIETAKARGTFAFAARSHVEHLHPFWAKGADDATYAKGREHFNDDHRLFLQRRRLWA